MRNPGNLGQACSAKPICNYLRSHEALSKNPKSIFVQLLGQEIRDIFLATRGLQSEYTIFYNTKEEMYPKLNLMYLARLGDHYRRAHRSDDPLQS